jgi:Fe-S-cluster containining protein
MSAGGEPPSELVSVNVSMGLPGVRVEMALSVPAAPVRLSEMLPVLQGLTEQFVQMGVQSVQENGKTISCRKGCGACCRQLVPVSEMEARRLRDLVESLPEPRRAQVRARFAAARRRLEEAGMFERLQHPETLRENERTILGLDYFRLGIACPFLEEESCSIYPDRPLSCREYLVTSPAENCKNPSRETIEMVPIPAKVSQAVYRFDHEAGVSVPRHALLILALECAQEEPDALPARPGPEWVRELLHQLSRKPVADPEPAAKAPGTMGESVP